MAEDLTPTGLPRRVALAAFEGWNDAGSAATGALEAIAGGLELKSELVLDPEPYHDFQVARPRVERHGKERSLHWPESRISHHVGPDGTDLVLVRGVEPSMRWRSYCDEIFGALDRLDVRTVICVGALLADVPHTRALPVTATSSHPLAQDKLGLEAGEYEGPTGIVGVLDYLAQERGLVSASAWVTVPHYVAQPPSPKATLALLGQLQDLLGFALPQGDLVEESRAWQTSVDSLASSDEEIADYVKALEEAKDAADSPDATGDAIAREFERYLRRRDDRPDKGL